METSFIGLLREISPFKSKIENTNESQDNLHKKHLFSMNSEYGEGDGHGYGDGSGILNTKGKD